MPSLLAIIGTCLTAAVAASPVDRLRRPMRPIATPRRGGPTTSAPDALSRPCRLACDGSTRHGTADSAGPPWPASRSCIRSGRRAAPMRTRALPPATAMPRSRRPMPCNSRSACAQPRGSRAACSLRTQPVASARQTHRGQSSRNRRMYCVRRPRRRSDDGRTRRAGKPHAEAYPLPPSFAGRPRRHIHATSPVAGRRPRRRLRWAATPTKPHGKTSPLSAMITVGGSLSIVLGLFLVDRLGDAQGRAPRVAGIAQGGLRNPRPRAAGRPAAGATASLRQQAAAGLDHAARAPKPSPK